MELLDLIYRIACLKGQAEKYSLPQRASRLVAGLQRLCHVCVWSRTSLSKVAGPWAIKRVCMVINLYRIGALANK